MLTILLVSTADTELLAAAASGAGYLTANPARVTADEVPGLAGRADLVCLARPHLADPYWTLHAAAKLGDRGETWPAPYHQGRDQLYRLAESAGTMATPV